MGTPLWGPEPLTAGENRCRFKKCHRRQRNWLVVLAANHQVLCGEQSQWEALLGGGYESSSEHNDSAKLGACDMTLCSDLKGQILEKVQQWRGKEKKKKPQQHTP